MEYELSTYYETTNHVCSERRKRHRILHWLSGQTNKIVAIREEIRAQIRLRQSGQDTVIQQAVAQELAQLPNVVAAAVQSGLAKYQLTLATASREARIGDPELAASLDEQLEGFV